jgi:nucleoside-diphosphate-sugar epimerase
MKKKTHLYILISSDSIYDVCDENKLTKPIKEESGQRPVSKEERRRLRKDEDYGEGKLRCEEFLNEVGRNEFPYISLRLADVIGP